MDINIKQFLGIVLGVVSNLSPYFALYMFSGWKTQKMSFFVGIIFGLAVGLAALIISIVTLKQAREEGEGKGKSIAGIIVSGYGLASCVIIGIVFGFVITLATSLR